MKKIILMLCTVMAIFCTPFAMPHADAYIFKAVNGVNCLNGDPNYPVVWEEGISYDVADLSSVVVDGNTTAVLIDTVNKTSGKILVQSTMYFHTDEVEGTGWSLTRDRFKPMKKGSEAYRTYKAIRG